MNRRSILSTTALVAPALALAACAITPAAAVSVGTIINKIQGAMSYMSGIVSLAGITFPGVSAIAAVVTGILGTASKVFAGVNSTMTTAAAQSSVGQIATILGNALTTAKQIIPGLPVSAQANATNLLEETQAVIADLTQYATGSVSAVAVPTLPVHMFLHG